MDLPRQQYDMLVGLAHAQGSSQPRDLISDQQTLAEAARFARRGSYQEAENLLASLPADGPLGPVTLDLKAKTLAQQGRLLEAELCWLEAVRQCPGDPRYRAALDWLVRARAPLAPIRSLRIFAVVVLALAATVYLLARGPEPVADTQVALIAPTSSTAIQEDRLSGDSLPELREVLLGVRAGIAQAVTDAGRLAGESKEKSVRQLSNDQATRLRELDDLARQALDQVERLVRAVDVGQAGQNAKRGLPTEGRIDNE